MHIKQVTMHEVSLPLVSPFETSFGVTVHRFCILLEVYSEGLVGLGECVAESDPGYSYETTQTAWHILRDYLIPALLETDIQDAADYQECVAFVCGHPMAKAGLEMAIWDLLGKRSGNSLQTLLGGEQDRVKVGVSVGIQPTREALVEAVSDYLADGYQRVKLKIKPQHDVKLVQAVRESFPEIALQVDANSAYSLESARGLAPLDDLDLILIEQPLDEDDLIDHSTLQKAFKTPLCLDESITALRHARQAIEIGACQIINIKPGRNCQILKPCICSRLGI